MVFLHKLHLLFVTSNNKKIKHIKLHKAEAFRAQYGGMASLTVETEK